MPATETGLPAIHLTGTFRQQPSQKSCGRSIVVEKCLDLPRTMPVRQT
jgi:hypothetical protein